MSPDMPPRFFRARRQDKIVVSPAHATASAQLGRENRNTNTASMTARYIPSRTVRCRFVFPASNVPAYWLVLMGAKDSTATPAMQRVTTGMSSSARQIYAKSQSASWRHETANVSYAAVCETAGQFAYIFALADTARDRS